MSNFVDIGNRLKEERERMGLSQTDFAAIGKSGRKSQFNYETGDRVPDGAYLSAIAAAGADVLYILTGVRSGAAPMLGVEKERAGYSVEVLDKQEQALLDNFRHCPQDAKQQITESSALYSKLAKKRA